MNNDKTIIDKNNQMKSSIFIRALFWIGLFVIVPFFVLLVSIPLTVNQQLLLALALLGLSIIVRPENENARYRIMVLVMISVLASGRYIYWRLTESLGWNDPALELNYFDYFFSFGLLAAEIYAWVTLFMGYFQTIWPLNRQVASLPKNDEELPSVDVFIPTYNEPLDVVIPTVVACKDLDWPKEKLNVYLLDDGNRKEFQEFSEEAGITYLGRQDNTHAKAGNINNGLAHSSSEYVAMFDCDHVPVSSFLRKTMGWFLKDRKLGVLQTPHFYYSPDPVENNLDIFNSVPNEGRLFYKLIQDGIDTWNASFFCGSCAVIRRESLEDIGGMATETVTEDAHTSLKIQKKGWNSAYINLPLAAGLATDRLSSHIRQRARWARGMIQIFRIDNPLIARGLTFAQRISYFNAASFFFFSLPRIVFLTAPLAYLFMNAYVIQASAAMIAVYALPHIIQAHVTNSAMQSHCRHSFWSEVYEAILAGKLIPITFSALLKPWAGTFNVTKKGDVVDQDGFDWTSSKFVFFLLVLNLAGLIVGLVRVALPELSSRSDMGTLSINIAWTMYNSIILGTAFAAAWEKRQRRGIHRLPRSFETQLRTSDGRSDTTISSDLSFTGITVKKPPYMQLMKGDKLTITLTDDQKRKVALPATVSTVTSTTVGSVFGKLSSEQLSGITHFTYSHPDSWACLDTACKPKKLLASFFEIIRYGTHGILSAMFGYFGRSHADLQTGVAVRGWLLFGVLTAAGLMMSCSVMANSEILPESNQYSSGLQPESKWNQIEDLKSNDTTFSDLGYSSNIPLAGGSLSKDIWFSIRSDSTVVSAQLNLNYSIPRSMSMNAHRIDIDLNGQKIGQIKIDDADAGATRQVMLSLPTVLIQEKNQIIFNLVQGNGEKCLILTDDSLKPKILPTSEILTKEFRTALPNDLAMFPAPFFDQNTSDMLHLPMVFTSDLDESGKALKAAAILASWFGAEAGFRKASFPSYIRELPDEHSIVFVTESSRPDYLSNLPIVGPGITMINHPENQVNKLLVIFGRNTNDLVAAVGTLTSSNLTLSGQTMIFDQDKTPKKRIAYDVPHWLKAGEINRFGDLSGSDSLEWDILNQSVANVHFRLPPDLYRWEENKVPVNLYYEYEGIQQLNSSELNVGLNGVWGKSFATGRSPVISEKFQGKKGVASLSKQFATSFPLYKLGGENQLSFYQKLELPRYPESAECSAFDGYESNSSIRPDSNIDLTGFTHFTQLPDLAKFVNFGFPFTKYADLSETTVVIPENMSESEISLMMNVFGHIGAATGVPAYHVDISSAATVNQHANKDLLVFGSPSDQPLLEKWEEYFQINKKQQGWRINHQDITQKTAGFWNSNQRKNTSEISNMLESSEDIVSMVSFQSPLQKEKTVVAFIADNPDEFALIAGALRHSDLISKMQGDTLLFSELGEGDYDVSGYHLSEPYLLGKLGFVRSVQWYFKNRLFAFIVISMITTFLVAAWMFILVKNHAARRLPA